MLKNVMRERKEDIMAAVQSEKILCGREFKSILYHSIFTTRERQLKGNKTRTVKKNKEKNPPSAPPSNRTRGQKRGQFREKRKGNTDKGSPLQSLPVYQFTR